MSLVRKYGLALAAVCLIFISSYANALVLNGVSYYEVKSTKCPDSTLAIKYTRKYWCPSIKTYSILAKWLPPTEYTNGVPLSYSDIAYYTLKYTNTNTNVNTSIIVVKPATSYTITGIRAGTYQFSVSASTKTANGIPTALIVKIP